MKSKMASEEKQQFAVSLTDEELISRLTNFEDNFVERKLFSDSSEWLKTTVSFANTAPIGFPAVLFIGVKDDGAIEKREVNLDKMQKSYSEKIANAYPSIYYLTKILAIDDSQFLAVIIPGSADRPHFAGQAYVRDGSQSKPASKQQFDQLIATRISKTYEILRWKDKTVTTLYFAKHHSGPQAREESTIIDANQYYVTIKYKSEVKSFPLNFIELSFDNTRKRLEVQITTQ